MHSTFYTAFYRILNAIGDVYLFTVNASNAKITIYKISLKSVFNNNNNNNNNNNFKKIK